jgi:hypothetical protein
MAEFTPVERQLLEQVKDDRLRTSLALIRQATEDIWAADAPRVIQDYTDHGIAHSMRLAGWAAWLLDANDGRPVSSQEMYLLLAGIYLHDVGMQCDIIKYPEIKDQAEQLGAQFDVKFEAQKASAYTIDEQKAIRKNHQYLVAAWISHAYRTGETPLGPAIKTVPEPVVSDLMDVCKYHAKLPITDCPLTLKFDPAQRKQLVAALLRFADELDIDVHRVSIETVKAFRLDPRNSVYWWLHNRTNVVRLGRNVIVLNIRLHPVDMARYGLFVHTAFITEFQSKNRPVLSLLAQNAVQVAISADSEVLEDDHAERLPGDVARVLDAMQQRHDPMAELTQEVRSWLESIRYEVAEPQRRDARTWDLLATLDQGTIKQRVLVRCLGGDITPLDVQALDQALDRRTPQGWLISERRVSSLARQAAAEDDSIQVFNLADFLSQRIWGPYFNALRSMVERAAIPRLYVDQVCYKLIRNQRGRDLGRDEYAGLDAYIDAWLKERGKTHISILGDFGSGKTWFCRHYAYRQLQRYLDDPINERLPLLVTLRAFAKAMNAQQLINDALLEQYRLPFVGSAFDVFQEMNRRGKLLLILDGFDEMARQVDYQTVVDNFWRLAEMVVQDSKVILTSRTEYFRWVQESEKVLGGMEYGRQTIVLEPPKFEVLYLKPFSDEQIREVLVRRLGPAQGRVLAERILRTPNLAEMAHKPVLIELLLAALDDVSDNVLQHPAQVYLYTTDKLLLRNIKDEKTFTSTSDKLYFLCELAWEMISSQDLNIHYNEIPERIQAYFGDRIQDQHELDTWDYDLRSQTLLHRDAAGYYAFAHKSLAEYFTAFKFAAMLGALDAEFAQKYTEKGGEPCTIPYDQGNMAQWDRSFGEFPLSDTRMEAVSELLPGMADVQALGKVLGTDAGPARLAAVDILSQMEGDQAAEILAQALQDTSAGVRSRAASELFARGRPVGRQIVESSPPLGSFTAVYTIGNDRYDESFSVETSAGEFLGEVGAGILERIGEVPPAKVAAFEVWLFDKNDIRTVTKVLVSEYVLTDSRLRASLAGKGELVLFQPGLVLQLSTATLLLEARVVHAEYGADPGFPPSSYFDRLEVELVVWSTAQVSTEGADGPAWLSEYRDLSLPEEEASATPLQRLGTAARSIFKR